MFNPLNYKDMKYSVKVFTPEFKAKVDIYIAEQVKRKLEEKGVPKDRATLLESFEALEQRAYLENAWNKKCDEYPEIYKYYKSIGLLEPEFITMELDSAEHGYQSRPRVIWNGTVQKIDEIDEIFSYKSIQ